MTAALLAGCASGPRGDGPPASAPPGLASVPDAQPRVEAIRSTGSTARPYTVLGRSYQPITDDRPFAERGLASWYGRQFHGQRTASGEPYDMYAMTAAHKTLPLPSYVRVRNPANGREAIVRVNDRGPFHDGRIIDLSYAAATRLGYLRGVAPVEIERITNEQIAAGTWRRGPPGADATVLAAAAPADAPAPAQLVAAERATAAAVPAGWLAPVGASATEQQAATGMAAPAPAPAPAGTEAAAAPEAPGRFRNMEVNALPPLSAAPAAPKAGAAAGAAGTAPEAASAAGYWVQLGAFREPEGAQALQQRAGNSAPALASSLHIFAEGGLQRLQAGPFPSRAAADEALAQWRGALGLAPVVLQRR